MLPVRLACNLTCPFCFSRSSISALRHDRLDWEAADLEAYYAFAASAGRLGWSSPVAASPCSEPTTSSGSIERGRPFFPEIACFTNGTYPDAASSPTGSESAGLSYLCYSRHHDDDARCRELMGPTAPTLEAFFDAAAGLKVRATCVMARGYIDSPAAVERYQQTLSRFGVREFTFKHTYVAYEGSVFGGSRQDHWAAENRVDVDPFVGRGEVIARLPWGPVIRRIGDFQVCYYYEPAPRLGKGAPVMPLDQPAVRRQRVRLAGGSPEPAVPVEHLLSAIQPDEVERFRPLLPVGYEAGVAAYRDAAAELTARDLADHYTSGLAFFHERFRAALEGRARAAQRRRLGPRRLRRLRRWFGRRFHDAPGRGGRRARPRLPVPGRLVRLPGRDDADGEPGLGRIRAAVSWHACACRRCETDT